MAGRYSAGRQEMVPANPAVVEVEKTAETSPTRDHTTDATFGAVGQDQTVLDALVIALVMVVLYVFADCLATQSMVSLHCWRVVARGSPLLPFLAS